MLTTDKITPNEKQHECIAQINGTVMVLAGPGTGKTFTLVERIKYMIEEKNIAPENILCLTFSDAAASEMKSRLLKKLGTKASAATMCTYHSFSNDIIKQNPSKFELFDNVNLIDDITKVTLMKQAMDEFRPKALTTKWGSCYFYIDEVLRAIDEIKKNQIDEKTFFETLEYDENWLPALYAKQNELKERIENNKATKTCEKELLTLEARIDKAKEIWKLYQIYIRKTGEKNLIDFNDMINFVSEEFDNDPEFLRDVTKNYKYLLIDEYQDTNFLQNKLIRQIAQGANTKNIFVVGDDDQIIYGFQGARADNLEKFLHDFPDTKVICLNENNRSTQSILDLSYAVISQDETRLEHNPEFAKYGISKRLSAKNKQMSLFEKKPVLNSYKEKIQENNDIVGQIQEILKTAEPKQIAVLTKEKAELKEFAQLLEAKNIPFQIKETKTIFQVKSSILTYFYLKAVENNMLFQDKLFALLRSEPFLIDDEDYNFLLEKNKPAPRDFVTVIKENLDRDWKNREKIKNFLETFEEIKLSKNKKSIKGTILDILHKTGILGCFANSGAKRGENILAIKRLLDEAETYENLNSPATLKDFVEHLDIALKEQIPMNLDNDNTAQNAVQLSTIHSSKGLEFEYVFMPNLISNLWEKKRASDKLSVPVKTTQANIDKGLLKKSEQLKLLFVGITRAKHSLIMSFSNFHNGVAKELTSYILNLNNLDNLIEQNSFEDFEQDYFDELKKALTQENFDTHLAFIREIKDRINNFTLSSHSLNTYQACPKQFLYSEIYKIPCYDRDKEAANYGSAIHKTIEWMTKFAKEKGRYPEKSRTAEVFEEKLSNFRFKTEADYDRIKGRGKNAIEQFYPFLSSINPQNIFATEYPFSDVELDGCGVKGFIDRIEKNPDGTFSLYDYKTGEAKKSKDFEDSGKCENYLNQLRFYKAAFEEKNKGAKVHKTGIIYVEEQGKNIDLCLNENDDAAIKSKIRETYEGIKNLSFAPKGKENDACKYCDYKLICDLKVL